MKKPVCERCGDSGTVVVILQGYNHWLKAMAVKDQPLNFPVIWEQFFPCDCKKGLGYLEAWPSMQGISEEQHARAIKLCSFNTDEKALYYEQRAKLPELKEDDLESKRFLKWRQSKQIPEMPELNLEDTDNAEI
jgi:hypothetical protein|tara:strand:- start:1193 stop:1594 length:402 start_codon:yes stop_codon:yes gene_type:complete